MRESKYFTLEKVEAYLAQTGQAIGEQFSFLEALRRMDREGLLSPERGPVPKLNFWMGHDEFIRGYYNIPWDAGHLLELSDEEFSELCNREKAAFPPGQDICARSLIVGEQYSMRDPEFFEIYYVNNGSCTMEFSGETIELTAGDLCILPPRSPHAVTVADGAFVGDILLRSSTFDSRFGELLSMSGVFSGFFREALYSQAQPNFLLVHTPPGDEAFRFRMRGLVIECVSPADSYTNSCAVSWMKLFLTQALRAGGNKVEIYRFPTGGNSRADCGEILQYIQQNYRSVRLSTLAREFHYNETYLSRMLQTYAHQSFTEIVRDIRMNRAVDYLVNSSLRVHEISGLVGYSSVDHFSRAFKALYGVSPQGYRRQHRA